MSQFLERNGNLYAESVNCADLAEQYGTPAFVYSRKAIETAWLEFESVLKNKAHLICYAVKANSNLAVIDVLARLGSGFDIVSMGELQRVLAAGGTADRTVFSGVGKTRAEMTFALEAGIRCFNVESVSELDRLAEVAKVHGVRAPVSLRINPNVDAQTHPYISTGLKENKFGIQMEDARAVYQRAADSQHLDVHGIDCHIGSQLTDIEPYKDALDILLALVDELADLGINLSHIDVGGGQGIQYRDETPLDISKWAEAVINAVGARELEILVEPGRYITGNAGVLLTTVEYLKPGDERSFCIVDAAMNDLIRPALYSAWQEIVNTSNRKGKAKKVYDVVGPVCESADFLGKERPLAVEEGDVLAVKSSGAYGFVMSSNYNTRGRAAEIMVDGDTAHLVRERELTQSLFDSEHTLPAVSQVSD